MVEITKKMLKEDWKNFEGRMSRSDFWWSYLGCFLLEIAISIIPAIIFGIAAGFDSDILMIFAGLLCLAVIPAFIFISIAMISAEIRRIRDAGFPWWFFFAVFIPYVGSVALIVFLCLPTSETPRVNFGGVETGAGASTVNQEKYEAPKTYEAPKADFVDVAPEEAPIVNTWFCPNCGAENSAKFCASCGTKKPE